MRAFDGRVVPKNHPKIGLGQGQTPDGSRGHRDASVGGNGGGVARVKFPMPFLGVGPDPQTGLRRPAARPRFPTYFETAASGPKPALGLRSPRVKLHVEEYRRQAVPAVSG
jgi:hypothetical protein